MKVPFWKLALCSVGMVLAGSALAAPTVIAFEDLTPGFALPGDTVVTKDGYSVSVVNGIGVVDTAAAYGPGTGLDLAAPVGTSGQFLSGLNDGAFTLRRADGASFHLSSFEAGFISPLTQLFGPGEYAGSLAVRYEEADGDIATILVLDAIANANGEFEMQTVSGIPELMGDLLSATFLFLTPDGSGDIVWPNANFNQFAIDNITVVPLPGTLALALLTLGVFGGLRNRRSV